MFPGKAGDGWRRPAWALGLCLAIGACAATGEERSRDASEPAAAAATPAPVGVPAVPPPAAIVMPLASPREKPPVTSLRPELLMGLTPDAVAGHFGAPDDVVDTVPTLVWRYVAGPCSVEFEFFRDVETDVFRALQYDVQGGTVSACLARLEHRSRE